MKKLLALILALALMSTAFSFPANAVSASGFSDVELSAWYYEAVDFVVTTGLFAGTTETKFEPDTPMTRAMFVTVLGRNSSVDGSVYKAMSFADVASSSWYGPYVEWAYRHDIVSGVGDNLFNPDGKITREQMATILYNYMKVAGKDLTASDTMFNTSLDTDNVSGYAKTSLIWATHNLIINGSDGYLLPQNTATRAQVAQMLYNSRDLLDGGELPDIPDPEPTPTPVPTFTPTPTPTPTPIPTLTPTPTPSSKPETSAAYVWIPKTGSKYHRTSTCSNMKNPSYVTIEQAISRGYTKCSKCW